MFNTSVIDYSTAAETVIPRESTIAVFYALWRFRFRKLLAHSFPAQLVLPGHGLEVRIWRKKFYSTNLQIMQKLRAFIRNYET